MAKTVPMQQQADRTKVWQAMRMLRRFRLVDVICASEAGRNHVEKYARELTRNQYLRIVQARSRGVPGGCAVYQLIRDTGPLAPRIGKQGLLDPNLTPAAPEPGDEPVTMKRRDYDHALLCVRACAGLTDEELRLRAAR